jgi:hypothetical protein
MATELPPEGPRPRVPLFASPSNREQSSGVDAKLLNGYVEKGTNKELFIYKRPGITTVRSRSGVGNGYFRWGANEYSIFGGDFYENDTIKGTVGSDITGYDGIYHFEIIKGAPEVLFFHNLFYAYNYNPLTGVISAAIGKALPGSFVGDTTSGSAAITGIPSTAGFVVDSSVTGAGVPDGSYLVSIDSGVQVTLNAAATATATGVTFTTYSPGMPLFMVPGSAYLDGTLYVMDFDAKIWGSDINDTTKWDALNYIRAQIEPDRGVALAKQLVYVIAFKEWSTEFFYDAGNPEGSPLGPVQGNKLNVGCRHAGSIQDVDGTLIWVSRTRSGSVGVHAMDNARGQPIGTPAVERLLQAATFTTCYSVNIKISGHKFYVLSLPTDNLTLVYDLSTGLWFQWTDTSGNFLGFDNCIADVNQKTMLQHATNGTLAEVSSIVYADNGLLFAWDLYTDNFDGGTRKPKYLYRMDVIADQVPGSTMTVRCSEDDYATWGIERTFDLSKARPNIRDCGTFLRRAWHFRHSANTPLRLEAVELTIALGTY